MRIIFIPGFGEDEVIFDKIAPVIPGDKLILNSWKLVGDYPRPEINVLILAKEIIDHYNITKEDIVIGHSMGGWIAFHIKHLVKCPIVQIASWTAADRVNTPVSNPASIYWAVKNGLYFNSFVKWLAIQFSYRNAPSKEIFSYVFGLLIKGNKNNVVNQLRLIATHIKEKISVQPDLRIHSRKDNIIKFPKEPFHEVPGDHFTLYTHPEKVYEPILKLIGSIRSK